MKNVASESSALELIHDPLDELGDGRAGRPLVARVLTYPRLPVLFRTEEVVHPSATAVEGVGRLRRRRCDFRVLDRYRNPVQAVGARVLDLDPFIWVVAADQQHEVDRSGYVEHLAARPHGVEEQAHTIEQPLVIVRWAPSLDR